MRVLIQREVLPLGRARHRSWSFWFTQQERFGLGSRLAENKTAIEKGVEQYWLHPLRPLPSVSCKGDQVWDSKDCKVYASLSWAQCGAAGCSPGDTGAAGRTIPIWKETESKTIYFSLWYSYGDAQIDLKFYSLKGQHIMKFSLSNWI